MANNYFQATMTPSIPLTETQYLALAMDCYGVDEEDTEREPEDWERLQQKWIDTFSLEAYENSMPILSGIEKDDNDTYYIYFENGLEDGVLDVLEDILCTLPDRYEYFQIEGAATCSKMRPGEFGGFAVHITRGNIRAFSTNSWLFEQRVLRKTTAA